MRIVVPFVIVVALSAMPIAHGVTLYKWVDEDGNVSYQDYPPTSKSGTVEEKHIDPNQGVTEFVLPKNFKAGSTTRRVSGSRRTAQGGAATTDSPDAEGSIGTGTVPTPAIPAPPGPFPPPAPVLPAVPSLPALPAVPPPPPPGVATGASGGF